MSQRATRKTPQASATKALIEGFKACSLISPVDICQRLRKMNRQMLLVLSFTNYKGPDVATQFCDVLLLPCGTATFSKT